MIYKYYNNSVTFIMVFIAAKPPLHHIDGGIYGGEAAECIDYGIYGGEAAASNCDDSSMGASY